MRLLKQSRFEKLYGAFMRTADAMPDSRKRILEPFHIAITSERQAFFEQKILEALSHVAQDDIAVVPDNMTDVELAKAFARGAALGNGKVRE